MEISNKSQSDNMIVGNCVACDGLVRIPLNANPSSIVRCPRCQTDFKLVEVLERAAPILEVIDNPVLVESESRKPRFVPIVDETPPQPEGRKKGDKFVVSPILQKNSKRKKHRRRHRSSEHGNSAQKSENSTRPSGRESTTSIEPSLEIDQSRTTAPKIVAPAMTVSNDVATDVARTPRPAPRRPRSPKPSSSSSSSSSGGLEMTKVILGAALALPVAQLLIWWFAGTDPLNLGPTVSRIMPFVVPSEFQPDKQQDKDEFFENGKPINDLKDLAGAASDGE